MIRIATKLLLLIQLMSNNILNCETFSISAAKRHQQILNRRMQRSFMSQDSLLIENAKQDLKIALIDNNGSAISPKIQELIEKLYALNPTTLCASSPLLIGTFITLTAPNFPDNLGIDSHGNFQYTLGRLTFNMLNPNNLVCSIRNIFQPVRKMSDSPFQMSYSVNISLLSSDADGSEIHSTLINDGYCSPSSEHGNRLEVKFTECILSPDYSVNQDLARWNRVFKCQAAAVPGHYQHVTSHLHTNDSICISMPRQPIGYLDILFLDDTMRITRGNRNSIVVVERVVE